MPKGKSGFDQRKDTYDGQDPYPKTVNERKSVRERNELTAKIARHAAEEEKQLLGISSYKTRLQDIADKIQVITETQYVSSSSSSHMYHELDPQISMVGGEIGHDVGTGTAPDTTFGYPYYSDGLIQPQQPSPYEPPHSIYEQQDYYGPPQPFPAYLEASTSAPLAFSEHLYEPQHTTHTPQQGDYGQPRAFLTYPESNPSAPQQTPWENRLHTHPHEQLQQHNAFGYPPPQVPNEWSAFSNPPDRLSPTVHDPRYNLTHPGASTFAPQPAFSEPLYTSPYELPQQDDYRGPQLFSAPPEASTFFQQQTGGIGWNTSPIFEGATSHAIVDTSSHSTQGFATPIDVPFFPYDQAGDADHKMAKFKDIVSEKVLKGLKSHLSNFLKHDDKNAQRARNVCNQCNKILLEHYGLNNAQKSALKQNMSELSSLQCAYELRDFLKGLPVADDSGADKARIAIDKWYRQTDAPQDQGFPPSQSNRHGTTIESTSITQNDASSSHKTDKNKAHAPERAQERLYKLIPIAHWQSNQPDSGYYIRAAHENELTSAEKSELGFHFTHENYHIHLPLNATSLNKGDYNYTKKIVEVLNEYEKSKGLKTTKAKNMDDLIRDSLVTRYNRTRLNIWSVNVIGKFDKE